MNSDLTHEEALRQVLDLVVQNNQQSKPGTPMSELKIAIEAALASLPPLDFEEFTQAIGDTDAADELVRRAPDLIGWNADQIVEWVEELSKKM
jgi:hypothetical protein